MKHRKNNDKIAAFDNAYTRSGVGIVKGCDLFA